MAHGPSTQWREDPASGYKSRLGLWMFLIYGIAYAGFIVINSVRPKLMGTPVGSLNLAIAYGFGLILGAFVMAVIYNALCSRAEERLAPPRTDDEADNDEGGQ